MNPDKSKVQSKSKKWHFPQRYLQITLISVCGLVMSFLMYSSSQVVMYMLPVFIPTNQTIIVTSEHKDCSYANESREHVLSSLQISKNDRYDWNVPHINFILTFIKEMCLVIGCFCGGVLSDLFGVKTVMLYSLFVGSITSLLIPRMMDMDADVINFYFLFAIVSFAVGLQEGSALVITAHWSPVEERTTLYAWCIGGHHFARAFRDVVCFKLMKITNNRNNPLYVFGSLGLVLSAIWGLFGYSSYIDCPYVTKQEYLYLKSEQYGSVTYGRKSIPLSRMFKSLPFWALLTSSTAHVFFWKAIKTVVPAYLNTAYGFILMSSKWFGPGVFAVVFFGSLLVALLTDILIFTEAVQITTMRKLLTIFGVMGPSILFVALTYNDCNIDMALAMALLGGFFGSLYYLGSLANILDLAPNYAGFSYGCHRAMRLPTNLGIAIYFHYATLTRSVTFRNLLWIVLVVKIVAIIPFMLFGSGEEESWNRPTNIDQQKDPEFSNESDSDNISL